LFHGISGLSNKDKKNIERIIIEMLDFDESKRMPVEELQIELELLLKQSEKEDNILNQKNAREKAIEELSAAELLSIFNSPHADNLIERIKMRPGSWQLIFNQLTLSQLLTLSEVRLLTLKENGLDFKLHCITSESIEKNNLNFKQLETLIKLGFSLSANTLTEWITTTNIKKDQEYPWASICRVLYQNSPEERESIRFDKKNESDFKSTFWQSCLMNEDSSSDDKLNCRLIKRHLELWNNYDFKINHEINKYHENTAYGKGLKLLISQYKQILLLSENIYMDKIYVLLKEFNYMKQLLIHTKPEAAENKAILMQIALFDEELLPMPDNKKQDFEQTLISTIRNYTEDLEKKIIKFKEIINAKSSQQNSYPGTFFGDNGNLINQDSQPCSSTLSP